MVVQGHTENHAHCLQQKFLITVTDIRQELAMFKGTTPTSAPPLNDHCDTLYTSIKSGLDLSLTNLQVNWLIEIR